MNRAAWIGVTGGIAVLLAVWLGYLSAPSTGPDLAASPSVEEPAPAAAAPAEDRVGRTVLPPRTPEELAGRARLDRLRALNIPRVDAQAADANGARAVVDPRYKDLRACHEAAQAHDATISRAVTLSLVVKPIGGGQGEIESVSSEMGGEFDRCAGRVLAHARLPANEAATLRYPLSF